MIAPAPMIAAARAPLDLSLPPVAAGGSADRVVPLAGRLRLRMTMQNTAAGPHDRVRSRVIGQMADFYPAGDHGFHLSAGTRLFNPRAMEVSQGALLPSARRLNVPGMKTAMRRAPALTVGYTDRIDANTSLGFEVGAMQGRAYNDAANLTRQTRADRNTIGSPLNPVANFVIGHRF